MLLKPRPRTLLDLGHPINRSCVAAFLLGEGQGARCFDSSVTRNDATFTDNGGGSPYLRNPWFPARHGGVDFRSLAPGSLVNSTILNHTPPTGSMWVHAEIVPFTLANFGPIVGQWNEGTNKRSWQIVTFSTGVVYCYASSDGTSFREYDSNATAITAGKRWTIDAAYPASGGTTSVYINGVLISAATSGDQAYLGIFNTAQPIYIGYSPTFGGGTHGFNGAIGNVRVWNRLPATGEPLALFNEPYLGYRTPPPDRKLYFVSAAVVDITPDLIAEAATATDTQSATLSASSALTEAATATETVQELQAIAESASASDALTSSIVYACAMSERAGARESVLNATFTSVDSSITEAATATDTVSLPVWTDRPADTETWLPRTGADNTWTEREGADSTWTEH